MRSTETHLREFAEAIANLEAMARSGERSSPARLLREGDLNEVGPLVLAAARAFVVGG